jgi:MtrB/PioB family decaheme-associated outer membrane protein
MMKLQTLIKPFHFLTLISITWFYSPAYSQDGEIEAGIIYVNEDSFKFGEYTGLEDNGLYGNASFIVRDVSDYNNESPDYWEISGTDLGLDSRLLYGEYGQQGKYRFFIEYDQIPHNKFGDAATPYLGSGTSDQTLNRYRIGGGFNWIPMNNWNISGHYRHEIKDGRETLGSIFGTNGGNPRAVILVVPVDYQFNDFDLQIGWTGKDARFQLSYLHSFFNNQKSAVTWDNAYDDPGNWCSSFCGAGNSLVEFSQGGRGRIGLEPDNQAQTINFNGAYNLGSKVRIAGNLSYGWMKQNEAFLPYSTVPEFTTVEDLPRPSLDGEIENIFANIDISARPVRNLNISARLNYEKRDNNTPRDVYLVVHSDSNIQDDDPDSTDRRLNRTYNLERLRFKLDAGIRLGMKNRLSFGYEFEDTDRLFIDVLSNDEHTFNVKLSTRSLDFAGGWIKYTRSVRNGSDYISNQAFLDGHDPAVIAAITASDPDALFENDPLIRRFNMADRDQDSVSASINFYQIDPLTFSMTGTYADSDYDKTEIGLQKSQKSNITFDVTFNPVDDFDGYAFITYDYFQNIQRGYRRRGGNFPPDAVRDSGDFWEIDSTDDILTVGAGLTWDVIKDLFNINLNYVHSHAVTEIIPDSVNQEFQRFPEDLISTLNSVSLTGEYSINEISGLRLKLMYEDFNIKDFALDNVEVNTLANVILLGNESPDYDVTLVGLSYYYKF